LPAPEDSRGLDSPVLLVDVDGRSPHRGGRVPVTFEWTEAKTSFQPGTLLATAPVFGFPLRPGTTYALIFRRPLVAPAGQAWGIDGDPGLRAVEETLIGLGIAPEDVSLAVPFTTQDPVAETTRIARTIQGDLGLPRLDQELTLLTERSLYDLYTGTVVVPVWQHGERPYRNDGGGFVFGADGAPEIAFWERVKFGLSVPNDGEMPEGKMPAFIGAPASMPGWLARCLAPCLGGGKR
jgi:hypothetical protein